MACDKSGHALLLHWPGTPKTGPDSKWVCEPCLREWKADLRQVPGRSGRDV